MNFLKNLFSKKPQPATPALVNTPPKEDLDNEMWECILNRSGAFEFDWFGADRTGRIAVFSSVSQAYIPDCVTQSHALYLALYDQIMNWPNRSHAIKVSKAAGALDDWENYSKKGLFAYDYQAVHGHSSPDQYDLLFKPESPVLIGAVDLTKYKSIIPRFDLEFDSTLTFSKLSDQLIDEEIIN